MNFAHPLFLYLLVLLAPLAYAGWLRWRWEQAARQAFAANPVLRKMGLPGTAWLAAARSGLLLVAWAGLVLALARPQGDPILTNGERMGSDVVLAVDVSESMKAMDGGGPGDRFNGAKIIINTILQGLQGDRVGLVAFAGSAATLCPLTDDYGVLASFIDDLDINAGVEPGSNLTAAVLAALRRFPEGSKGGKAILIFSDGEDLGGQVPTAGELAAQRGIPIVTVGLGSTRGAPIPVGEDMWGNMVYKQYEGQEVVTRLDDAALKSLARMSGGHYVAGQDRWKAAQAVLAFIRSQSKQALRSTRALQYEEFFPWWLALAGVALLAELALALGRYRLVLPARRARRRRSARAASAASVLLVLLAWGQVAWTWPWEPSRANNSGLDAFERKDFGAAEQAFRRAATASKHFVPLHNLGNTLYREQRYRDALKAYQQALQVAPQDARSRLHYNLGNTYFRMAKDKQREPMLRKALEEYNRALRLDPGDEDARYNADLVQQLLQKKPPPPSPSPSPSPKGKKQKNPSPGPSGSNGSPSPSASASGGGPGSPSPAASASGSPGQSPSAAPSPGQGPPSASPEEQRQIEDFLRQMERNERTSQNYFRRRRPAGQQPRSLADIPVEELMNMTPEELAELLKQQYNTGQAPARNRGGKDW